MLDSLGRERPDKRFAVRSITDGGAKQIKVAEQPLDPALQHHAVAIQHIFGERVRCVLEEGDKLILADIELAQGQGPGQAFG